MGKIYYVYLSLAAGVILYMNMVKIIKRIKNDEPTAGDTLVGCICMITIIYSIFAVCGN